MNMFWLFVPWLPYEIEQEHFNGHCKFLNSAELFEARPLADKRAPSDFPTAKLQLALQEFDADCFSWEAYTLVSERMRDAMALGPSEVEYLDVDSSQSAPGPRSKNYKIMRVPIVEDVSDVEKSAYYTRQFPESSQMMVRASRIAIRPDAKPRHELFQDRFFTAYVFCTDALAVRVLKKGCTGMRFLDIEHLSVAEPKRFRTLRGLEEAGEWDPAQRIVHTTLIHAIH
jgi:hypothetical protein